MKVEKTEFEDAGTKDEKTGLYDYYYKGATYQFTFADKTLWFKSYSDKPGHVYFNDLWQGEKRIVLDHIPYEDPDFKEAFGIFAKRNKSSPLHTSLHSEATFLSISHAANVELLAYLCPSVFICG